MRVIADSLRRVPASALAVAAIFSVQFGNALVGSLFERVPPLGAAALRLGFAALILLLIVRPRTRGWTRRIWFGVVLLGIGMGGMNVFIYLAIERIPMGLAVTIELLGPLAVAVMGVRRALDVAWVLLALGGVMLLGSPAGGSLAPLGVAFALAAASFWALYILASARIGGSVRGVDGLAAAMAVAAILVVPIGAVDAVHSVLVDPSLIGLFVVVALLTSVVPYALEFLALKRMPSRVFGVLSSLGPAVAAFAGLVVLQQTLGPVQLLAIVLVVAASAGVVLTSRAR